LVEASVLDRYPAFTVHYRARFAELEGILNFELFKSVSERLSIRNWKGDELNTVRIHEWSMVLSRVQAINVNFLQDKAAERFAAGHPKCALHPASQAESEAALQNRYGISYIILNQTG